MIVVISLAQVRTLHAPSSRVSHEHLSQVEVRALGGTAMSKQDLRTPTVETLLESQDFRLPAVDRAMSLFELLANSQQGLTLSELSRKLSIPNS